MTGGRRGGSDGEFQVGPAMWVKVRYQVFDEDGEAAEENPAELEYVHGMGALLPALESALEGQPAGSRRSVSLGPNQAFGPRKKSALVEFAREDFPPDVSAGDRFDADTEDGGVVLLRVLEVQPDVVLVDMNHPLAGQRVRFELEVMTVRPATEEELSRAERQMTVSSVPGPVIPLERLLRAPTRRYEINPPEPEPARGDDDTTEN